MIDFVKDIVNKLTGYKDQQQYFKKVQRQLESVLSNNFNATGNEKEMNVGLKGFEEANRNKDKMKSQYMLRKYL